MWPAGAPKRGPGWVLQGLYGPSTLAHLLWLGRQEEAVEPLILGAGGACRLETSFQPQADPLGEDGAPAHKAVWPGSAHSSAPAWLVSLLPQMHQAVSHPWASARAVPAETFLHFILPISPSMSFLGRALPDLHPGAVPSVILPPGCCGIARLWNCTFSGCVINFWSVSPRTWSVLFIAVSAE